IFYHSIDHYANKFSLLAATRPGSKPPRRVVSFSLPLPRLTLLLVQRVPVVPLPGCLAVWEEALFRPTPLWVSLLIPLSQLSGLTCWASPAPGFCTCMKTVEITRHKQAASGVKPPSTFTVFMDIYRREGIRGINKG